MTIILRISTICPAFREIMLPDIEETIFLGKRNLGRFCMSVKEFEWHLEVLQRLDAACETIDIG